MGKNCPADLFAPAVLAQPGDTDERMTFAWAMLEVRVPLVIHVVEQADGFPQVCVRPAERGEIFHRIGHGVAMFAQAFRLHPLVQRGESAISEDHG